MHTTFHNVYHTTHGAPFTGIPLSSREECDKAAMPGRMYVVRITKKALAV